MAVVCHVLMLIILDLIKKISKDISNLRFYGQDIGTFGRQGMHYVLSKQS